MRAEVKDLTLLRECPSEEASEAWIPSHVRGRRRVIIEVTSALADRAA